MKYFSHLLSIILLLTICSSFCSCENKRTTARTLPRTTNIKLPQNASTQYPTLPVDLSLLEIPKCDTKGTVIAHLGYTVSYNHQTLTPNWVAYELTREEVNGQFPRTNNYAPDPTLKGRQASLEDFRASGWDRGHLAPAADMKWSQQAMDESFYLTNMCPQNKDFNAGAWEKTEKMARRIASQYGKVYVVCGPVYKTNSFGTIGTQKVAIPDAFFKAFLIKTNGTYSAIGFLMQNITEHQDLKASSMTVDQLEEIIQMDLFHNLEDSIEHEVEARIAKGVWGI